MQASAAAAIGSMRRRRQWITEHGPWVMDAMLAGVLTGSSLLALASGARAGIPTPPPYREADTVAVALVLGQAGPLVLVRRHPVPAFAAVAAAYLLAGLCRLQPVPADAGVLLALYLGVVHSRDRRQFVAAGVLVTLLGILDWVTLRHLHFSIEQGLFRLGFGLLVFGAATAQRSLAAHAREAETERAVLERKRAEAVRALAQEWAALARDLHDVVTHRLTTMVVQADAAQTRLDGRSREVAAALAAIAASGREALAELRELLTVLQPDPDCSPAPARPPPGLAGLAVLLDGAARPGRQVTLTVQGDRRPLQPEVQLAMYRIVQESLTNALRHGGDVPGDVTVRYGKGEVELEIGNDGPPPAAATATASIRRGMIGMRHRAAVLGGELTAGPRPDGGYRVRVRLPDLGPF